MKGRPAAAFALLCLLAVPAAAGATLYVARTVVADPGALCVRDVVQVQGAPPAAALALLDRTIATVGDLPLSVPASLYAGLVEEALGTDCILVGSRTLVVPRGRLDEGPAGLLARLADFLAQEGILGDGRAELQAVQPLPALAPAAALAFGAGRPVKGPAGTEVACTITSAATGEVLATVTLRVRTTSATAGEGVRAGDPVQVRFRKGPLTIEVQGKALASAGFGDTVAVYIPDSLRRFSGRVMGTKAVDVELP